MGRIHGWFSVLAVTRERPPPVKSGKARKEMNTRYQWQGRERGLFPQLGVKEYFVGFDKYN